MKKYRKCKNRRVKPRNKNRARTRNLRGGSKEVKAKLLELNPHCDICGSIHNLQLHHVFCIRHNFRTQLNRCVLLCGNCHKKWHAKNDKRWDELFRKNPNTDFMEEYNTTKGSLN